MTTTLRRGMTLVELTIVLVLIGAVSVVVLPRIGNTLEGSGVRSAKQEIAAALANARAMAIQNGAQTTFERSGNSIRITMQLPTGVVQTVVPARDLKQEYGVTLGGLESMSYNTRGFASGLAANPGVIRIARGAKADSLCILGRGKVMTSGCQI